MSVKLLTGDIFEDSAEVLVNPVNCQGIMGAGLAKVFKEKFPKNYISYTHACNKDALKPGVVQIVDDLDRVIANFPTKTDWRLPSEPEYIVKGLATLHNIAKRRDFKTIAMPALGCGLGGLDFAKVLKLVEQEFGDSSIDVRLYVPR